MTIGAYVIKNIVNNKIYVGSSVDIKKRLKRGETQKSIANLYGVSRATIGNIKNEKVWSYVTI